MNHLKGILQQIFDKNPQYQARKQELSIYELWPIAVGDRIAKHARPVKMLENQTLLIATENSSWSHHLRFLEKEILLKLNKTLGKEQVRSLRFCVQALPQKT